LRMICRERPGDAGAERLAPLLTLVLVLILVSQAVPALTQSELDQVLAGMPEEQSWELAFPGDGTIDHYEVTRWNSSAWAFVWVTYNKSQNSVDVRTQNVRTLVVKCRSIFEDECGNITGLDPADNPNLYKEFFLERERLEGKHLSVHVQTLDGAARPIESLSFEDIPMPQEVYVDNAALPTQPELWTESVQYDYSSDGGAIFTNVPAGSTDVDLYFLVTGLNPPSAVIDPPQADVRLDVPFTFDASGSSDDGTIMGYHWDFGDGGFLVKSGTSATHTFGQEGNFSVLLTVEDDDGLLGRAWSRVRVYRDLLVPDGRIISPPSGALVGEKVAFEVEDDGGQDDDVAGFALEYADAQAGPWFALGWQQPGTWTAGTGGTLEWDSHEAPDGWHYFRVVMDDSSGNRGYTTPTRAQVDNEVPVADAGEDGTVGIGSPFTFDAGGSTDNTGIVNWTWHFGDGEMGYGEVIQHTYSTAAVFTASLEVRDAVGNMDVDHVNVTVRSASGLPPSVGGIPLVVVHYGRDFDLDLTPYVSDPDTPVSGLIVTTSEPASRITASGLTLTFDYPEEMVNQNQEILVTVSDGKGSDEDTTTVSITDNYPPSLLSPLPDVTFNEGKTKTGFDLDDHFTDDDGDELTFHPFGNSNINVLVGSDNAVTFTAKNKGWSGSERMTIRAYDPFGAFVEDTFWVNVVEVNMPPVIAGVPSPIYIGYSHNYTFDLMPYVADDDPLEDLIVTTSVPWINVTGLQLLMYYNGTFDPATGRIEGIKLTVDDGFNVSSQDIQVIITTNPPPELLRPVPDIEMQEDAPAPGVLDLKQYFSDDAGITGYFAFADRNVTVNVSADGIVGITLRENWHGEVLVTFRVQDQGNAIKEDSCKLRVLPMNDPPELLLPFFDASIGEGDVWIVDLSKFFRDVDGDELSFSCNAPSIHIDQVTHVARWSPGEGGSLAGVTFTADDGEATTTSNPIDLDVVRSDVTSSIWFWFWLAVAALCGAAAVLAYRMAKYRYEIREIFLINNSGILLYHASATAEEGVDEDLFGSMLTAIQDFVRESFAAAVEKEEGLGQIEYGDLRIIMERGEKAFLAVVIDGYDNSRLRRLMIQLLTVFEERYADVLKDWDGNIYKFKGTDAMVEDVLGVPAKEKLSGSEEE